MHPNSAPSSELRRLRGIPSHLEQAIAELENSLASSEGEGPAATSSPLSALLNAGGATNSNLTNQLRVIAQRLSEFVARSHTIADEEAEALEQERQKNAQDYENAATEVALAKLRLEESQLQLQSAREEVEALKRELEIERSRVIQLEKSVVEMRHQEEARAREKEGLEARFRKAEDARAALKEQRDVYAVQLSSEQARLAVATTALEAEKRMQRRRTPTMEQAVPVRASTPPVSNCTTCFQVRQELSKVRAVNEKLRHETAALQERAIQEREISTVNERRLQDQLNRSRKLATQERSRAEKLAYLHAALAADRRNSADLIATLQGQLNDLWDNQRQPRVRSSVSSVQSPSEIEQDDSKGEVDERDLGNNTLVLAPSQNALSLSQNYLDQRQSAPAEELGQFTARRRHSIPLGGTDENPYSPNECKTT